MTLLALILAPIFVLAQSQGINEISNITSRGVWERGNDRDKMSPPVHLTDQTNPIRKDRPTDPTKTTQFCLDKAEADKRDSWRYAQALERCVNQVHAGGDRFGHQGCSQIVRAVDQKHTETRANITTACNDHYGYEACREGDKKTAQECLKSHASSLSPEECQKELTAHKLTNDQASVSACKNGSNAVAPAPKEPVGNLKGKGSTRP